MLAVLLFVQAALFMPLSVKADQNGTANRMNVVFVMDGSGSMKQTDKDALRYEALELFTALSADNGNYMGAVVFDDDIIETINIGEMTSKSDKDYLAGSVRNAGTRKDTDIGKALSAAVDMLNTGANRSLPSIIILLSDGNTDVGNNSAALAASKQMRDDAVNNARAQGIQVYSICLNSNNGADPEELRLISDATGGQFREIKTAEDLKDVFNMFYGMIYSTETKDLGTMTIPEDGELLIDIEIPSLSVEEANIIINTLNDKTAYSLTNPSGDDISEYDMEQMTTKAKSFSVIKVPSPAPGLWKLHVTGIPGDQVQVNLVYNHDLSLELQDGSNGNAVIGQPVTMTAVVYDKGAVLTDMNLLNANPVHLSIKGKNTGYSEDAVMDGTGITYDFTPNAPDDYELYAYVDVDGFHSESNIVTFSIVNETPEAKDFEVEKTVTPFTKPEKISLSVHAKDAEDSELTFSISSSTLKDGTFSLKDDKLEIDVAKCGKGVINLTATDSAGASADFKCTVKTFNVFVLLIIILGVLLIGAAVVVIILVMRKKNRMVSGNIRVIPFSQGMTSMQEMIDGDKGQMILGRYLSGQTNTGINYFQSWFEAGDRPNFIYFCSKQGYTTDLDPVTPSKKIRLDDQIEVTIFGSEDQSCGIRVTYMGMNDMGFGGGFGGGYSGGGFGGGYTGGGF